MSFIGTRPKMYLSKLYLLKLQTVFVQIDKCICWDWKFEFTSCPASCYADEFLWHPASQRLQESSGGDAQTDETPLYMEIHRRAHPLLVAQTIQRAKFDPKCGKTRCKYTHKASGLNSLSPVNFSPNQPCWNQLNKTPLTPTMKDMLVISFRKYMTSYSPSSENQKIYDIISGETLCRDNCQLIGMSLIGLARQAQKNRD